MKLWMAPLHGLNNYSFRNLWMEHFGGIDEIITPFISLMEQRKINTSRLIDFYPEHNPHPVIPQVIGNKPDQLVTMAESIFSLGYDQINLNLGCPASQVVKHRRGAGLIVHPEIVETLLWSFFNQFERGLSVKIRIGLKNTKEIYPILDILNKYPLEFVCIHPRLGSQMYEGQVNLDMLQQCVSILNHRIIYSGDIKSAQDIERLSELFPTINDWMIGRQLIVNPFLPEEIKFGKKETNTEKRARFIKFNEALTEKLSSEVNQERSALNKLKEYWTYFTQYQGISPEDKHSLFRCNEIEEFKEKAKKMILKIDF
jgi:tRNA-dihydrouridine synthase B